MKKVCFVIQRYGIEVNGGAELLCRQIAEQLRSIYDIEIITTKAIDYISWRNEYTNDIDYVNGIKVYRYGVEKERDIESFASLNSTFVPKILGNKKREMSWIIEQGPYCPQLIDKIKDSYEKNEYTAYVFFTYLYYTTIEGLPLVSDKAILLPTAHDEPYLNMSILKDVFCKPRFIIYNTEVEMELVQAKFKNIDVKGIIGGVGVDVPASVDCNYVKETYHIDNYIVYVGRVDTSKLCDILISFFIEYKKQNRTDLKLLLVGKVALDIPERNDIITLGFVSDKEKFDIIAGAEALVLPSRYESLSMVVLEAMTLKVPVLVNGECPVLKRHCVNSNGGLYYTGYAEFEGMLNYILTYPDVACAMGKNGAKYVEENYQWDKIKNKLGNLIESI